MRGKDTLEAAFDYLDAPVRRVAAEVPLSVVAVATLAAWLTLVLLADRHPRGRSAAADAAHDHEETAATVTDLPSESPPSGKAAA